MIIDVHTHITSHRWPELITRMGRKPFTASTLLYRMDQDGIDQSVLLPIVNPENADWLGIADSRECIAAAHRHPDRLIAFCSVDPRSLLNTAKADFSKLLKVYRDLGCKGIGEVCANLPFNSPLCLNLFRQAGDVKMPVLFHIASRDGGLYGLIDRLHLPGLEQALRELPKTVFIGHSPAFWCEIDGAVKEEQREGYPKGRIARKGHLWRLMDKYPNLYADLSAGSGFNALTRDPARGFEFLKRYSRRCLFGTDRFTSRTEPVPPLVPFMKKALDDGKLTRREVDDITHRNFQRLVA